MAPKPKEVVKYKTRTKEVIKRVTKSILPSAKDGAFAAAGGVLPAVGAGKLMERFSPTVSGLIVAGLGVGAIMVGNKKKMKQATFVGCGMIGAGTYMAAQSVMANTMAGPITYEERYSETAPELGRPIDYSNVG